MFVTLNDPIGCAEDIASILHASFLEQQTILDALETGVGLDAKEESNDSDDEEQIRALFQLALTTYQLVYNDQKMISDYHGGAIGYWNTDFKGSGIRKEKILNILGVEERKEHRSKITTLRDDLGYYTCSDYYKNAYVHAEEGTDLNGIDGKFFAMQPLKLLAIKPHLQDKIFDLNSAEEVDTKWDYLILEYLKGDVDSPVYNVLNKTIDIDENTIKQGVDLSNKLAAFVKSSLETFASYAAKDVVVTTFVESTKNVTVSGNYELTLRRLNTLQVYGEDMFEVRGYEVQETLKSSGWRIDNGKVIAGTYKGKLDLFRWVKSQSPELVLKETSHGKHVFNMPVIKEVEEVIRTPEYNSQKQPTNLGAKATKVLDGAPFRGVIALLQVFNIGAAYHTFSKDMSKKSLVNLSGISAEFTSATLYLAEKTLATTISSTAINGVSKIAFGANAVGSGVTAIMCTWEACLSFDARDTDAGFAWGGAAAAFAGATAMIFVSTAWAGPVGWACAGIGVGLVFLAYYFTDSPIEKFFKNNALSDEVDLLKSQGELTGAYNKRFYLNRNTINPDSDFKKYNDFKFAGAILSDFMVCSDINVNILDLINEETSSTDLWEAVLGSHETVRQGDVKIFQFVISFRQFLRTADQLAYNIYFYENGIKGGSYEKLDITTSGYVEEGGEKTPPSVKVDITIPNSITKKYKPKSQILIVCALSLGNDKFYPAVLNEQHRFLGAFVDIHHSHTTKTTRVGSSTNIEFNKSNVAVKPLDQLLSSKAWEN